MAQKLTAKQIELWNLSTKEMKKSGGIRAIQQNPNRNIVGSKEYAIIAGWIATNAARVTMEDTECQHLIDDINGGNR